VFSSATPRYSQCWCRQILLFEPRVQVDVDLRQCPIADINEAVRCARFDHKHVALSGLVNLIGHDETCASLLHNDHLVVLMTMQPGSSAWLSFHKKDGNRDVAIVRTDEVV